MRSTMKKRTYKNTREPTITNLTLSLVISMNFIYENITTFHYTETYHYPSVVVAQPLSELGLKAQAQQVDSP